MPEKHIAAELRRLIRDQAHGTCEYCRSQERFSPQRFSIEHIKPYSAGGQPAQENLALSWHPQVRLRLSLSSLLILQLFLLGFGGNEEVAWRLAL